MACPRRRARGDVRGSPLGPARVAARVLAVTSTDDKNAALRAMADALEAAEADILAANETDVTTAREAGTREALLDAQTGFLVPRRDAGVLTERLAALLEHPDLRARLGAAGRERFEENFTFGHMFRNTLAVYDEMLSRRTTGVKQVTEPN